MVFIPGNSLPSRNSKNAPPAVEIKEKDLNKLNLFNAATVSPPPATEKILSFFVLSAIIFAISFVPFSNKEFSKRPAGPFQKIVFELETIFFIDKIVSGPMEFVTDISKVTELSGWTPKHDIASGLKKTYEILEKLHHKCRKIWGTGERKLNLWMFFKHLFQR